MRKQGDSLGTICEGALGCLSLSFHITNSNNDGFIEALTVVHQQKHRGGGGHSRFCFFNEGRPTMLDRERERGIT